MSNHWGIKVELGRGLAAWAVFEDNAAGGDVVAEPKTMTMDEAARETTRLNGEAAGIATYFPAPMAATMPRRIASSHARPVASRASSS